MTQDELLDIPGCFPVDERGDSPASSASEPWQLDVPSTDSQEYVDSKTTLLPPAEKILDDDSTSPTSSSGDDRPVPQLSNCRKHVAVAILFLINLLNYMDRFTIAGVLIQIQKFFGIQHAMTGLLQTVFIISYMLVAPLFGYLGDRYNRKVIMIFGMVMWSGFTLLASFVQSPELFPLFLSLRALVGIGEASYCTIAPTLIADMFVEEKRTQMLGAFYLAIPIGSGLGYIVGSQVALAFGSWEWALRVTPVLGVVCILLLAFFCPNPPRGASETTVKCEGVKHTYIDDLRYLLNNKSFIMITLGFTFAAFVIGSLTLWGPVFFAYSQIAIGVLSPCVGGSCDYAEINFIFGLITCIAGIGGIVIGAEVARRWKKAGNPSADPLVCGIGMIISAPLLLAGVTVAVKSLDAAWVCIFLADVCLCLMWTLVADMTLYITLPDRRSTANAVMILTGHLLGDAGSPYLIGQVSDILTNARPDTYMSKCVAMQQAMYVTLFACILGGGGFLVASLYIVEDKEKVDIFLKGSGSSTSAGTTSSAESQVSIPMKDKSPSPVGNGVPHCYVTSEKHAGGAEALLPQSANGKCVEASGKRLSEQLLVNGRETVI